MGLFFALLGYGYVCFDGYGCALRLHNFCQRPLRENVQQGYLIDLVMDAVLMGGAITLALHNIL